MGDHEWGRHNTTRRGIHVETMDHERATTLFAIKVSVDDDMLEYLMEVETPTEALDNYASMFAKKPKPIKDKFCYQ